MRNARNLLRLAIVLAYAYMGASGLFIARPSLATMYASILLGMAFGLLGFYTAVASLLGRE